MMRGVEGLRWDGKGKGHGQQQLKRKVGKVGK